MKVMKFGGTSVMDDQAVRRVGKILYAQKPPVLVVVSALSGVTNSLVEVTANLEAKRFQDALTRIDEIENRHKELARKLDVGEECDPFIDEMILFLRKIVESVDILGEVTVKTRDLILSAGELLSSFIIQRFLTAGAFSITLVDPRKILKTVPLYGETEVDWKSTAAEISRLCMPLFNNHDFIITGGFVGSDSTGKTTTLGRGGSDYSAAIFSSLLHAEKLEIWTDVDGILTADPRMVPEARLVQDVTYAEASELAYFGAKVLHPKTIFPSVEQNIPVYVMNTFRPGITGTRILAKSPEGNKIKAVTFRKNITVINIHSNRMLGAFGFLANVFDVFKKHTTPVDLVSTSEVSISVTIDSTEYLDRIIEELGRIASTSVYHGRAIISAIGEGIKGDSGIATRFFAALNGIQVSLVTMGASEINLSIVVGEEDLEKAVRSLHYEFFEKLNS
jgi:aspartate kinase